MVLQNMLIIANLQRVHEQQRQWRPVFLLLLFDPAAAVVLSCTTSFSHSHFKAGSACTM
jgi:hypothetical protein